MTRVIPSSKRRWKRACHRADSGRAAAGGMELAGILFKYGDSPSHVAFAHSCEARVDWRSPVVLSVAGLGGGLFPTPYSAALGPLLAKECGSTPAPVHVMVQLRSSYGAWGAHPPPSDADDVHAIVRHLLDRGVTSVVVIAHSSGCQAVVAMLKAYGSDIPAGAIRGVVLHAPVRGAMLHPVTPSRSPTPTGSFAQATRR